MKRSAPSVLRKAFAATVPVMAGYIVLGIGFGIIMRTKGYGVIWSFLMAALVYAGSMQYVAIDLMCAGASLITLAITTLMVNARHLFYGISMVDKYKNTGRKKPYLIFALTDETYSLVCSDTGLCEKDYRIYCLLVSLFDQCYWVTGCTLGALLGAAIPFNTEGIDFALTALFVTIVVEQWLSTKDHLPAIIGIAASVICLAVFGADKFLIPTMLLIALALTLLRRRKGAAK